VTLKSNVNLLYHLVAFVTIVIWGSTFVFTKLLLLAGLSAAQIFTLRFIIAYVLLLAYSIRNFRAFADSWRDELLLMALGVTGGSVYFLAENEALNYTTATNTSLIVCSCPLVASVLIGLFYKAERMSRLQTLGALMAVAGVCVVVLNGHFVLHLSPIGDTLALAANLCWALYSVLMIPAGRKYDSVFITRKVFFYGLLTIIPYYIWRPEELDFSKITFTSSVLFNLLFLGCVASMACFLAWTWVIKRLGAMVTTNYVYLNPVATIVFAWWILSEQITPFFLLGTVLILLGMYLADKKKA
jgi:drug/metabolite transporter (DMT)-like permease